MKQAEIEVMVKVDQTELDEAIEKAKWLKRFEKDHELDTAQNLRRILKRKDKALSKAINVLMAYDYCPLTYFEMIEDEECYKSVEEKINCKEDCLERRRECWRRWLLDEE